MVDTESIRTTRDGNREPNIKLEFINEINIPSTDQTVKYVLANIKVNYDTEIIWFIDGGAYDINDNDLKNIHIIQRKMNYLNLFVNIKTNKLPS